MQGIRPHTHTAMLLLMPTTVIVSDKHLQHITDWSKRSDPGSNPAAFTLYWLYSYDLSLSQSSNPKPGTLKLNGFWLCILCFVYLSHSLCTFNLLFITTQVITQQNKYHNRNRKISSLERSGYFKHGLVLACVQKVGYLIVQSESGCCPLSLNTTCNKQILHLLKDS